MSELADRIKLLRGKKSREEFAILVGISQRALVTYEQSERVPKIDFAERICAKTGARPEWFLMGEGPMYQKDTLPSKLPDNEKKSDMSDFKKDNTLKSLCNKKSESPTVGLLDIQHENAEVSRELFMSLREQNRLTQENGDLRVEIERKKARIAELERELVRILKGEETSPVAGAG